MSEEQQTNKEEYETKTKYNNCVPIDIKDFVLEMTADNKVNRLRFTTTDDLEITCKVRNTFLKSGKSGAFKTEKKEKEFYDKSELAEEYPDLLELATVLENQEKIRIWTNYREMSRLDSDNEEIWSRFIMQYDLPKIAYEFKDDFKDKKEKLEAEKKKTEEKLNTKFDKKA